MPYDEQTKPDLQHIGRDNAWWHADPQYDQPGDQEMHVPYTQCATPPPLSCDRVPPPRGPCEAWALVWYHFKIERGARVNRTCDDDFIARGTATCTPTNIHGDKKAASPWAGQQTLKPCSARATWPAFCTTVWPNWLVPFGLAPRFCSRYTFLVAGYGFNKVFARTGGGIGNTGPGALLQPGGEHTDNQNQNNASSFVSLSLRTVLHDSDEVERRGLGIRRSMSVLAPHLLENPIPMMVSDISGYPLPSAPFRLAVSQAKQAGIELLIVGESASLPHDLAPS